MHFLAKKLVSSVEISSIVAVIFETVQRLDYKVVAISEIRVPLIVVDYSIVGQKVRS